MADTLQTPDAPQAQFSAETVDAQGKPVHIYAIDNTPRTVQQFDAAMDEYDKTKRNPTGFVIAQPGVKDWMNEKWEAVQNKIQPVIQSQFKNMGESLAETVNLPVQGITALGEKAGILPPGYSQAGTEAAIETGGKLGPFVGSTIRRPEDAAATVASLAFPASAAMKGGLSLRSIVQKAIQEGAVTTAAWTGAKSVSSDPPTKGEVILTTLANTAAGGAEGAMAGWVDKYLKAGRKEKVAQELIDIVDQSKVSAGSTKYTFDQVASTKKFSEMVQKGTDGLRGELDDIVKTYVDDVSNVLPVQFGKNEKISFTSKVRKVEEAGNEVLRAVGTDDYAKKVSAYNDAVIAARSFVTSNIANVPGSAPLLVKVNDVMERKTQQLLAFTDAAEMLNVFSDVGQKGEFTPVNIHNALRDRYLGDPNKLMGQTERALGYGQNPLDIPQGGVQAPAPVWAQGLGLVQKMIPGPINRLPNIADTIKGPAVMPWELSRDPFGRLGQGAIRTGIQTGAQQGVIQPLVDESKRETAQNNAMKSFTGSGKK
jgi:hypothetical protein